MIDDDLDWPWCEECNSYHHPTKNITCKKLMTYHPSDTQEIVRNFPMEDFISFVRMIVCENTSFPIAPQIDWPTIGKND